MTTSVRSAANAVKPTEAPRSAGNRFRAFAERTARMLGSPWAFLTACGCVIVWALTGPTFHFSDTWQMVINTGTTIVTFLMVFLLQNTQTRDTKALHLKLDELLRAVHEARTTLVGLEQLPDDQLKQLSDQFTELAAQERESDPDPTGTPPPPRQPGASPD